MDERRSRLFYLDALRVFATVLVICLHCFSGPVGRGELLGTGLWWGCSAVGQLCRAGVPLFFMISGALLLSGPKTLEPGPFYKRRFGRILPAFFLWDGVYYLWNHGRAGTASLGGFLGELADKGSCFHLWFVYQIGAIYLFLPFLKRIVDGCSRRQLGWLTVLTVLPQGVFGLLNAVSPVYFSMQTYILLEPYLGYVLLGYLLGTWEPTARGRRVWMGLGLAALGFACWGNFALSSPEEMTLLFNRGYAFNHFLTAAGVFVLFQAIPWPRSGPWAACIHSLSGVTYGVYLAHPLAIGAAKRLVGGLDTAAQMAGVWAVGTILCFAGMWALTRWRPLARLVS